MNDRDPRFDEVASRLRELPECTPPERVWIAVREGLVERARTEPRAHVYRAPRWWPAALAASLVAGVLLFVGYGTGERDASTLEPQRALADRITMLSRRSQALERELAELPSMQPEDPATLRVLAGRIASVDDRLSATHVAPTPATEALWRTRVDLMESYTRLRREEADALLLRVVY